MRAEQTLLLAGGNSVSPDVNQDHPVSEQGTLDSKQLISDSGCTVVKVNQKHSCLRLTNQHWES